MPAVSRYTHCVKRETDDTPATRVDSDRSKDSVSGQPTRQRSRSPARAIPGGTPLPESPPAESVPGGAHTYRSYVLEPGAVLHVRVTRRADLPAGRVGESAGWHVYLTFEG